MDQLETTWRGGTTCLKMRDEGVASKFGWDTDERGEVKWGIAPLLPPIFLLTSNLDGLYLLADEFRSPGGAGRNEGGWVTFQRLTAVGLDELPEPKPLLGVRSPNHEGEKGGEIATGAG